MLAQQEKAEQEKLERYRKEQLGASSEDLKLSSKLMDLSAREIGNCNAKSNSVDCSAHHAHDVAVVVADTNGGLGNQMAVLATNLAVARRLGARAMVGRDMKRKLSK